MIDGACERFISDCHVRAATDLLGHRWDPVVLSALRLGPTRRKELLQRIAGMSDKVLTQALRRLQARALVTRGDEADPLAHRAGAVYQLTPLGASFAEGPLTVLARWAADNQAELA